MKYADVKRELLQDDEFRKEYSKRDIAFEIAKIIIKARSIAGVTQARLAKLMKTQQPSVARAENGNFIPSIPFLLKMAEALGAELVLPYFDFSKNEKVQHKWVDTNSVGSSESLRSIDMGNFYVNITPYILRQDSRQMFRSSESTEDTQINIPFSQMQLI